MAPNLRESYYLYVQFALTIALTIVSLKNWFILPQNQVGRELKSLKPQTLSKALLQMQLDRHRCHLQPQRHLHHHPANIKQAMSSTCRCQVGHQKKTSHQQQIHRGDGIIPVPIPKDYNVLTHWHIGTLFGNLMVLKQSAKCSVWGHGPI